MVKQSSDHPYLIIHSPSCRISKKQTNAMQNHLSGSSSLAFQPMPHQRQSQMTNLGTKRRPSTMLHCRQSQYTREEWSDIITEESCYLPETSQLATESKALGPLPGLLKISCLDSFLGACSKHCTFLHHNPVSVYGLCCP